eukprot:scaffold624_cov214-Pinguiococcus_pyrenoidosus.AAC.6
MMMIFFCAQFAWRWLQFTSPVALVCMLERPEARANLIPPVPFKNALKRARLRGDIRGRFAGLAVSCQLAVILVGDVAEPQSQDAVHQSVVRDDVGKILPHC